jgi:endonuclease/exonuclease/phosphatase family metal-dependent hydrolase
MFSELTGEVTSKRLQTPANPMRIATFNLESFGYARKASAAFEERAEVLRPQLERLKADVLCLQEVDAPKIGTTRRPVNLERLLEGTSYAGHALAISSGSSGGGPADVHNLAVLSRLPIVQEHTIRHSLVKPLRFSRHSAVPPDAAAAALTWDRPLQHLVLALASGRHLHIYNVHLRAPLAAAVPGQKSGPFTWKTVSGWAEGFFAAAVKRAGQALELRLAIERVFDAEPDALIAACGDFNAEDHDTAPRLACAGEDDTGSGHLAGRVLTPVERTLPADRRFTVLHHGRPQMLDHILASRTLFAHLYAAEIHNEMLEDELVAYGRIDRPPESLHAPVVAMFDL